MARTFISQPNQIVHSEGYNDALTPGSTLQTNATNLQEDLNAIRTQIRQILWASVSGSWYDVITAPSGSNSARGLNTLNSDLTDLEQKRLLHMVQNLNLVEIATGSNFTLLSVSLGTAPSSFAVVGHPNLPISIATGSFGVGYTIMDVSGSTVTSRSTVDVYQLESGSGYTQHI